MSQVMKGLGLAHVLAEAFDNSRATFGLSTHWNDDHLNALTTQDGKSRVLGPMLDVLRGDAQVVPVKRVIDMGSMKPGDTDKHGGGVVVLDHSRLALSAYPTHLTLGEFKLGVASLELTRFYAKEPDLNEHGVRTKEAHVDVPDDECHLQLDRELLIPRHLIGKCLPGIALRNFYLENPQHIPECFSGIVLFWGTICKNDWCYYVPGMSRNGSEYGRCICSYKDVNGKDVLSFGDFDTFENGAAVLI